MSRNMKKSIEIVCLLTIIICLGTAPATYAQDTSAERSFEMDVVSIMELRARSVMRVVDPKAIVVVRPSEKKKVDATELPGTPFVLKNLEVGGEEDESLSYEVEIWTSKHPLPTEVTKLISDALSIAGYKVSVKSQAVPSGLISGDGSDEPVGRADVSKITEAIGSLTSTVKGLPEEFGGDKLVEGIGARITSFLPYLIGGFAAFLLARIATLLTSLSAMRKLGDKIREALAAGSSSQGEGRAVSVEPSGKAEEPSQKREAPAFPMGEAKAREDLAAMTAESLLAMISDLRWSARDGVASWLWSEMPDGVRRKVIAKATEKDPHGRKLMGDLEAYVGALVRVPPEQGSYHKDAAYLNPLPIFHLGNETLADMVSGDGGSRLYQLLPLVRRESIPISNITRLNILAAANAFAQSEAGPGVGGTEQLFARLKEAAPSQPMPIPSSEEIIPIDDEEELTLISMAKEMSWNEARAIVSLAHYTRVSDPAVITRIFDGISAREAASGLVGPAEMIEQIMSLVPEARRGLINSYRSTAKRNGVGHRRLCKLIAEAVDATEKKKGQETQPKEGAGVAAGKTV